MKKKKNKIAQIVAIFALLSIIIGVVGTGMLAIFGGNYESNEVEYTQEEIEEILNSLSGSTTVTATGSENDNNEVIISG